MNTQHITKNQWIGLPEQLPQRVCLRVGALQATMLDGRLLDICFHGEKLIDEVYFALRDPNWGTIPYTLSAQRIEQSAHGFAYYFQAVHAVGNYQYRWQGSVTGSADGRLTFLSTGEAGAGFAKNRLGFCVLHPISCAGLPCEIEHSDGTVEKTAFPQQIAPHQPFFDIAGMTYQRNGLTCNVTFEGDVFECEDQRNWTDASFKTYCTPLSIPFPVQMEQGEQVTQAVHIHCKAVSDKSAKHQAESQTKDNVVEYSKPLPLKGTFSLGTCLLSPLQQTSFGLGKSLGLHHVRVEIHFHNQSVVFDELLNQAAHLAHSIHLAVFLTENWRQEVPVLCNLLAQHPAVSAVFLHQEGHKVIDKSILFQSREMLSNLAIPIGSGTDAYFTQLNREPLPRELMDFVCYSNNPQVHAFDNHSIMQTTAGQAANLESAQGLYPEMPIYVTPVTLKIRWNPDATAAVSEEQLLLSQIDNRQMSLMCASWMLRSIVVLSTGGATSATYFELAGPRGFFAELEDALPEGFPAFAGMVYPSYYVLREALTVLRGQNVRAVNGKCFSILMNEKKVLIANTTDEQLNLCLSGWPNIKGIRLDDDTVRRYAVYDAEQMTEDIETIFDSALEDRVLLQPYSVILGNFDK